MTSSESKFCCSSQSKNPSPASPDHSVPSQSNTAMRSSSCNTELTNSTAWPEEVEFRVWGFILVRSFVLRSRLRERRVLLRRVHVDGDARIIYRNIFDVLAILVFDIASRRGHGSFDERLNHFSPDKNGMSMFAAVFWDNSPFVWRRGFKCRSQLAQHCRARRRAIDERNHRRIAPTIQHLMQTNLKGTELPTRRVGISEQKCAVRVRHRCELRLVIPSDDDHQVILLAKCAYCGREKSLSAGGRSRTARRPEQQSFVPAHAGRFPRSKNHAAPTRSPAHVRKIAEREYFRLPISNCRFEQADITNQ